MLSTHYFAIIVTVIILVHNECVIFVVVVVIGFGKRELFHSILTSTPKSL